MSLTKIESLTPEQEALIPVYREKWKAISLTACLANALSTEPINRQKASDAVKAAYTAVDKEEPEILFFDSPNLMLYHAALNKAVLSQTEYGWILPFKKIGLVCAAIRFLAGIHFIKNR